MWLKLTNTTNIYFNSHLGQKFESYYKDTQLTDRSTWTTKYDTISYDTIRYGTFTAEMASLM